MNNMKELNKVHKSLIVTLSFFMICATTVYTQQVGYPTSVSLQKCREMALENNIEGNIAKEQINAAGYRATAYKTNYFPKVSATGGYLYTDATMSETIEGGNLPTFIPDGQGGAIPNGGFAFMPDIPLEFNLNGTYNGSLRIEQPIFTGGKITAAHKMAKTGLEMAQVNEKLSTDQIILLCDEAYWNCVKAEAMIVTATQYKETLQELFRTVEGAVEEGMTHRKDLLSVQVKMNEAELNLTRAENGYRLAIMNLNHIIGVPLHNATEVADSFDEDSSINLMPASFGASNSFDITLRPEYNLLSKQVEMKMHQVKMVRSDFLPNVGVMGMYGYTNGLKMNGEKLLNGANLSALLSVSIPIFNWGEGRNKIKEAKMEGLIAEMQLNHSQQKMTLEATQAMYKLNEAQLEVTLSSKSVEQAQENMKVSKERYNTGMETLSNYMEAQTMWQNAMSTLISAKASLNLSKTTYLKATGRL